MLTTELRHYWHPVAPSSQVQEKPMGACLLDERLALFRSRGQVVAFKDLCIHRGTALSLGWMDGDNLVCAYHGWTYAPDGACIRIPSLLPAQGIPKKARAVSYRVEERYGLVWVCLGKPRLPIPDYPQASDPSFRTTYLGELDWQAGATRVIENFMDISHFPFVHPTTLGHPDYPITREHTITQHEDGFTFDVDVTDPVNPSATFHLRSRTYMPFTILYARDVTPEARFDKERARTDALRALFFTCSPLSAQQTKSFWLTSQNYTSESSDNEFKRFGYQILEEDRRIVESQRPEEVPIDLSEELHLKGPDITGIEYRRWLTKLRVETDSTSAVSGDGTRA